MKENKTNTEKQTIKPKINKIYTKKAKYPPEQKYSRVPTLRTAFHAPLPLFPTHATEQTPIFTATKKLLNCSVVINITVISSCHRSAIR